MPERVTRALGRANIDPDSGRCASSVNSAASGEWGKFMDLYHEYAIKYALADANIGIFTKLKINRNISIKK